MLWRPFGRGSVYKTIALLLIGFEVPKIIAPIMICLSGCTLTINCNCQPTPQPPTPPAVVVDPVKPEPVKPEPVVETTTKRPAIVASGVKWFVLIIDPSDPSQAAWRTDSGLRSILGSKGIQYRSFVSTEEDLNPLGYRSSVRATGVPCLILQDVNGKMIKTVKPSSLGEVLAIAEGIE
jgi:hypothetical protein